MEPGESPSILNLRNPSAVYELHQRYIEAGSDAILTNTFSANPLNISNKLLKKVLQAGADLAVRAAKARVIVLGDVGPIGELIKPYGEVDFEDVLKTFKKIFYILHLSGIKRFMIETFTSIIEAKAAFLAAKNFTDDIFVSLSLQDNGRTVFGEPPESIAITFSALGARAVGINCTTPETAIEAIERMSKVTRLPLLIKPNAGKVKIDKNRIYHTYSDIQMARFFKKFVRAGANIIGGCCGTGSEYIRRIARHRVQPGPRKYQDRFYLASPHQILGVKNEDVIIVGERLNPSGRKKVKEQLLNDNYSIFGEEARLQEKAGAHCLDVNAFVIEKDELTTMKKAVFEVIKHTHLPLFIDTQNFDVAEKILSFYPGVGVYNSIPARRKELLRWLPLVKKYGFKAVISLIGKRIPRTCEERIANLKLALGVARELNFPAQDLIFDPLVFSSATEPSQVLYTLQAVEKINQLGLKTILGISNVSFGLPGRSLLNAQLVGAAIRSGTTFLILNPLSEPVMNAVASARALFRAKTSDWISQFSSRSAPSVRVESKTPVPLDLVSAIVRGNKKSGVEQAKNLLNSGIKPQQLIDDYIARALKTVGDYYETGRYFIPDLLRSASVAKAILQILKKYLPKKQKKGRIVLATVKGDIHDIGKNIAGMIFESAGYYVIDLGKDVPAEKIIRAVKKYQPDVVGLSALLTTTMPEMENVIKRLREHKLNVKVIIGGPNVSSAYAHKIGAYAAVRNVLDGLKLLKEK
ncbi:hypothetical protein BXT86_06455 [candidate division WOR-3 bacterium 4484_100]|uniref:Methionine synthase n=1 Tax=candidate division WOR-3 bacterium 4484_100 TaxID=1936077 RepID=A0A1V4QEN2_UNCW3|nr:MAG: hypothetical protein BXT86_06455 [candidate division WOR-3 bacterium 4484_100]